jgi:hypothetical protein
MTIEQKQDAVEDIINDLCAAAKRIEKLQAVVGPVKQKLRLEKATEKVDDAIAILEVLDLAI